MTVLMKIFERRKSIELFIRCNLLLQIKTEQELTNVKLLYFMTLLTENLVSLKSSGFQELDFILLYKC